MSATVDVTTQAGLEQRSRTLVIQPPGHTLLQNMLEHATSRANRAADKPALTISPLKTYTTNLSTSVPKHLSVGCDTVIA